MTQREELLQLTAAVLAGKVLHNRRMPDWHPDTVAREAVAYAVAALREVQRVIDESRTAR